MNWIYMMYTLSVTWGSILLDCWCSYFVVLQVGHQWGYIDQYYRCMRLEVWPTVGLSRQRYLFRVLSTHTRPPPFNPPITQWSLWWPGFKRISPPGYSHACHTCRWQLKCFWLLSSVFDGLDLWSNDRLYVNIICWIPFMIEEVRRGS